MKKRRFVTPNEEEEIQDESFTKAQLESKRKEALAHTKTKAELLEEDDNGGSTPTKQTSFERFEVQESIKDWATSVCS